MREIPLSQGMVALIDDEDWERVSAFKWYAHADRRLDGSVRRWYARANVTTPNGRTTIKLHRFLMNAPDGTEVDHKDHDGLNCTRSNIRLATKSQNLQNQAGPHRNSSTGVRGVRFDSRVERFVATAMVNGRRYYFGWHKTLEDAASAVAVGRRTVMTHAPECLEDAS